MATVEKQDQAELVKQLADRFHASGYVRWQDAEQKKERGRKYKKGNEVRLVAGTKKELAKIHRLLVKLGFRPGRPFAKDNKYRLPLYGKTAVARFLELVGDPREKDSN